MKERHIEFLIRFHKPPSILINKSKQELDTAKSAALVSAGSGTSNGSVIIPKRTK